MTTEAGHHDRQMVKLRQATSNPNRNAISKGLSPGTDRQDGGGMAALLRTHHACTSEPTGPDAAALKAQNRVLAAGGKLSDPEKFKRERASFRHLSAAEGARRQE